MRAAMIALVLVMARAAMAGPDDAGVRERAHEYRADCVRAWTRHDVPAAAAACRLAVTNQPDDHRSWYSLGAVLVGSDMDGATDAFQHAATLRPDEAMYQLWLGVALEVQAEARGLAAARARDPKADQASVRLTADDLAPARAHLERAIAIAPALWRAHHYLGRIMRALDDPRGAAEEFSRAIFAHPSGGAAYVALTQLYLNAGYIDQAIVVATQGLAHAEDPRDHPSLWRLAAAARVARGDDGGAIEALDHLLAERPDDLSSQLARGAARARIGDVDDARADLEHVIATTGDPIQRSAARQALQRLPATRKR
jgi:tetratricopeptide (TPR) repeat protein